MPIIPITDLGRGGIIRDIPAHALPLNAFSSGENVRFRNEALERGKGQTSVMDTPTIDPYFLMPYDDAVNLVWFYANATAIYRSTGLASTDVTRTTGGAYSADTYPLWHGGVLGGVPILNHYNLTDVPQYFDGTDFENLTNWPTSSPSWYANNVGVYKNFLVAIDMQEDGVRYPTRVRWSDAADPGAVPAAWIPAANNSAGSSSLSETTAFVIDQAVLAEYNILYKEDSVWAMRFVGGEFVMAFSKLFDSFGILTARCVASFQRKHFVVTRGDVIVHNTQQFESVITDRYRDRLFNTMDTDYIDNTFVVPFYARDEMWICYTESGSTDGLPTRALIWNWKSNTWTERVLPGIAYIANGNIPSVTETTTFDGQNTNITINGTFDADSNWGKGTGWTIGSGVATHAAGTASNLTASVAPLTLAIEYTIIFDVVNYVAGTITPYIGSGGTGTARSADGTYQETITCSGSTDLYFAASSAFDGDIDNVHCSIKVSFDSDSGAFDTRTYQPASDSLVGGMPGGSKTFYEMNTGNQYDGVNYRAYAERIGLPVAGVDRFGKPIVDLGKVKFIRALYPKVTADTGTTLTVYIGSQMEINGSIAWGSPYSFDPSTDLKIDCAVTTRFVCVRFESTENKMWEIQSYDLDLDVVGKF